MGWNERGGLHTHVQNPEKQPDCRTDLIGGGGKTFAPGDKYPRATTGQWPHNNACIPTGVLSRLSVQTTADCLVLTDKLCDAAKQCCMHFVELRNLHAAPLRNLAARDGVAVSLDQETANRVCVISELCTNLA